MTITEKVAYLKGLVEGLDFDKDDKETKVINAVLDVLDDIALTVSDLDDEMGLVTQQLDEVDEDLAEVEELIYDEDDEDFDDDEEFSVECPNCGDLIYLDLESLEDCDKITCPGCNEEIELEFDCDCENCSECCED